MELTSLSPLERQLMNEAGEVFKAVEKGKKPTNEELSTLSKRIKQAWEGVENAKISIQVLKRMENAAIRLKVSYVVNNEIPPEELLQLTEAIRNTRVSRG